MLTSVSFDEDETLVRFISLMSLYFKELQFKFRNFSILNFKSLDKSLQTFKKYKLIVNNSYLTNEFNTIRLSNIFRTIKISDEANPFEMDLQSENLNAILELINKEDFQKQVMLNEKNFKKFCSSPNFIAFLCPGVFIELINLFQSEKKYLKQYISCIFFCLLTCNFQTDLLQFLINHDPLSKFINLDLFCLLYHYANEVNVAISGSKGSENKPLWELHWNKILSIKKINLSNHPKLSSITYKSLFLSVMEDYFFEMKLMTPEVLHVNSYFKTEIKINSNKFEHINQNLKDKILNVGEEIMKTLIATDLSEYDDFTGEIICQLIKVLPNLETANLNKLNLNDDFCEKLSDILMNGYFLRSRRFHLNICNNYRITNVGLKSLFMVFKYAQTKLMLNSTLTVNEGSYKKDSGLKNIHQPKKSEFMALFDFQTNLKRIDRYLDIFQINSSKKTTMILKKGLGSFLINHLSYLLNKKSLKLCYDCEVNVCSQCHSFHNIDKSCIQKSSIFVASDCKTFRNQIIKKNSLQKKHSCLNFMKNMFGPCFWVLRAIIQFFTKGFQAFDKKLLKILLRLSFNPQKKGTRSSCLTNFLKSVLIGRVEDFKINSLEYKYSENANKMNSFISTMWFVFIFRFNFFVFLMVCILPPLFLENIWYAYLIFVIYSALLLIFEFASSLKIITIMNRKEIVVKSFSFLSYGRQLYGTLLKKYSAYANFIFMIQNMQVENYLFSIFSLTFLSLYYFYCFLLFNETGRDYIRLQKTNKYSKENLQMNDDYQSSLINLTGMKSNPVATHVDMINNLSRTAVQMEFDCLTSLLDQFSTKNAIKLWGMYIPQTIIMSFGKSFFYDIPNFILQVIRYSSLSNYDYKSMVTLTLSILSIINSILRLLNAKASKINKEELKSLEEVFEKEEELKESVLGVDIQIVY